MILIVLFLVVSQACVCDQTRAVMFNRGRQNSCGQRAGRRCYGRTYNIRTRGFCCGGQLYPCSTPAGWNCCGKRLVHSSRHFCCNHVPFPRGSKLACCNERLMDVTKSVCCAKRQIQPKQGSFTRCCHRLSYDTGTQVCCNKKVIQKEESRTHPACASTNRLGDLEQWHFF